MQRTNLNEKPFVLLVDDNSKNLQLLGQVLMGHYRTAVAINGIEALKIVDRRKPDLILLDIMMPDMDGFEVCQRLKASDETRDIPVIFLTAKTQTDDIVKGFDVGAVDYVTKPFQKEELLARVRTHVSLKQTQEALRTALAKEKALTQEAESARLEAEKANQAKSEFLARMSHEIRTPMNAIIGMTDLTLETPLNDHQRENLITVKESANHLLEIINDILDLSKIEAGRVELEYSDFDLVELVDNTLKSLSVEANRKHLYLRFEKPEHLPRWVCGDPLRLRQILTNLVGNAIKFTQTGGITVRISLMALTDGKENPNQFNFQFSVKDTGIGIAPEHQTRIFETFSQGGASIARKFGGTGLGLPITRQLIHLMGGTIGVQSQPGQGTLFTFNVLLGPGKPETIPSNTYPKPRLQPPEGQRGLKVLVAEDNPINAKLANTFLQKMGHIPCLVDNGEAVLELLNQDRFDAVLMDLEMPKIDGIETTRLIRQGRAGQNNINIPVIAMTAHALGEFKEKCQQAGMDDYVTKPINFYDLNLLLIRLVRPIHSDLTEKEPLGDSAHLLLNRQAIYRRLGIASEQVISDLYEIFLDTFPAMMDALRQAVEKMDFQEVRIQAHALKSPCGAIGADSSTQLAEQIELLAVNGNAEQIRLRFQQLNAEVENLIPLIQAEILHH